MIAKKIKTIEGKGPAGQTAYELDPPLKGNQFVLVFVAYVIGMPEVAIYPAAEIKRARKKEESEAEE